jgi:hypothetical protein
VTGMELVNLGLAIGWAAYAAYLSEQRFRWKDRAMRAERRSAWVESRSDVPDHVKRIADEAWRP